MKTLEKLVVGTFLYSIICIGSSCNSSTRFETIYVRDIEAVESFEEPEKSESFKKKYGLPWTPENAIFFGGGINKHHEWYREEAPKQQSLKNPGELLKKLEQYNKLIDARILHQTQPKKNYKSPIFGQTPTEWAPAIRELEDAFIETEK